MESQARVTIDACIDAVAAKGHCEFVTDLAAPVPLRLIADMIGLEIVIGRLLARLPDLRRSPDCPSLDNAPMRAARSRRP